MSITAEQARENSKSSNHGTEEVLRNVYSTIEAVSNTGSRSTVTLHKKEAVSEVEMAAAISDIESKGYEVTLKSDSAFFTLTIKW